MKAFLFILIAISTCSLAYCQKVKKTYCVIDMGSKSVKLSISSIQYKKINHLFPTINTPSNIYKKVLGIGSDVDANYGKISDENLAILEKTLIDFKNICAAEPYSLDTFHAIATAAYRDADSESRDKIKTIASNLNLNFEILTKEKEALFGYLASTGGEANSVSIDIGSRSFQISSQLENKFIGKSFNLGYMYSYEHFYQSESDFSIAKKNHLATNESEIQNELNFVTDEMKAFILGGTSPEYLLSYLRDISITDAKTILTNSPEGINITQYEIHQKALSIDSIPPMIQDSVAAESRLRIIIIDYLMNKMKIDSVTFNTGKLTDGFILSLYP